MSLNFTQITELIDRNCKSNSASYPIDEKTADINLSLDKALDLIFKSSGRWQFDDSNHDDYPIITTSITQGQRDYPFVTDESGNLILDIYKVMVKSTTTGQYEEIYPVDVQSDQGTEGFYDGLNTEGKPYRYDKTANSIFLDQIPDETVTNGLKVYINREGSYFQTTDTTKKAGFAGLFHEYLALRPSYQYAYRNSLQNKNDLKNEMLEMESAMKKHYRDRNKDEVLRITTPPINSV